MPKYWGKQIFSLGIFIRVRQKQKTGGKEKKTEQWPATHCTQSCLSQLSLSKQ